MSVKFAPKTSFVMLALVGALLLLLAACGGSKVDDSLTNLEAGDCIEDSNVGSVEKVDTIDCGEAGAVQVVEVFDITGYDDEYPGDDAMQTEAADGCPDSTTLNLVPTQESWEDGDDREVICFADPGSGDDDISDDSGDDGDDDGGDDSSGNGDDDSGDDTGDDDSSDSGAADVCGLASEEEIGDILGAPVTDDDTGSAEPFFSCSWQTEDFTTVYVTIYVDDQDQLEQYYSFTDNAEEIDGLGSQAQWSAGLSVLEVLVDDYDVSVQVVDLSENSDDVVLANAREVAELILDRLDR